MATWRCPHCGTPQAETSRCWVCRRSSTACGTCRHYRRAVAAHLGYCGLDRGRSPLVGDEIRACWEASPAPLADAASAGTSTGHATRSMAIVAMNGGRDFVEVGAGPRAAADRPAGDAAGAPDQPRQTEPVSAAEPRWTFWGESEP